MRHTMRMWRWHLFWMFWFKHRIPFPAPGRGHGRKMLESYVKRLEKLEKIATSFRGVSKSFAIQAGREIRIMVEGKIVSDEQSNVLCRDIAKKIEKELTYPGQIRVIVIRETRAVSYAK